MARDEMREAQLGATCATWSTAFWPGHFTPCCGGGVRC